MAAKKHRVVLIEDDTYILRAYKAGLEKAGFEVIAASNGQEGLDKIRAEMPDVILLDLVMPVKNGFEVLEALGKEKSVARIPVIILSNLGQESDVQKGKTLGAVDYLIKTDWSMQEVIEKIKFYIPKK